MDEVSDVQHRLQETIEVAKRAIVVNLGQVEYIDSSGVGLLVSLQQWARTGERKLILCELNPAVEKVFRLSNLIKVFEIASTENEAFEFLHPRRVFLFDEREDIRFFYQEVVQANHLTFLSASSLDEAMQRLTEEKTDLVLIDAQEKDEPKYELVRRMKQEERLAKIPILVLSTHEDEEFQFSQFGVDRFVLKPFLVEKFVATLKHLIAQKPG